MIHFLVLDKDNLSLNTPLGIPTALLPLYFKRSSLVFISGVAYVSGLCVHSYERQPFEAAVK